MRKRRNPGECPRCGQAMPPAAPAPPKPLAGTWGAAIGALLVAWMTRGSEDG